MRLFLPPSDRNPRGFFARVIDAYNPGVTMLVSIWAAGFALRTWLVRRGLLTQVTNEALMSLLFVVPIMLLASLLLAFPTLWGIAAVADRWFKLGLFRSNDDQSS